MMLTIAAVVSLLLALLSIVYALKGLPNDKIIFHSMSRLIIKRSSINSAGMALHSTREPFDRNKKPVAGPPPPINEFIKADKVRLIVPKLDSDSGEEVMLGIFSLKDALLEAEKMELDLVLINDKADPPVCKVIDYGKFKYGVEKKKKENAKKQVKGDIKEVKMSYKIDQHDFDVRVRAVQKFINDGDRVSILNSFLLFSEVFIKTHIRLGESCRTI